ncbi:hypothetical protein [Parasediminibacterium sp. JCM 36343]|uniref:hypothetical protein n=1 Tax=Parasediminibacterium sp. JCM 36343 TaxID=3374279 RepID=UPI003977F3A4
MKAKTSSLFKNEGIQFIGWFLCLFVLFYYFNLFFISITARGSNPLYLFLRDDLNYIDWLRSSILHTSQFFCGFIGIKTHVEKVFILRSDTSHIGLRMVYRCIGYGVMSFWTAFVIANKGHWQKKTIWLVAGWVTIWLINCFRMTLLMVALEHHWPINKFMDHHSLFNIVAYIFVLLLIFLYIKFDKPKAHKK